MQLWRWVTGLSLVVLLGACTTTQPNQSTLDPQANYWQQVGHSVAIGAKPSMAQTNTGIPVVAYSTSGDLFVKFWNGFNWQQLGGALNVTVDGATKPSLAIDSFGNPVVSWAEGESSTNANVYVKRWNGINWVQLGSSLDIVPSRYALDPSLALDNSGNPLVSWSESNGTPNYNIHVARWNGSGWVQLGSFLNANNNRDAYNSSLALDSFGNPVVSWDECFDSACEDRDVRVSRWNGSVWISLGELDNISSQFAFNPSLALDGSNNPVVVWEECTGNDINNSCNNYNIYVKRWISSSWVSVGTALNFASSRDPSLALDSLGNPVVAYSDYDGTSYNINVKQWNGSSWNVVGTDPLDTTLRNSSLDSSISMVNGNLFVAWAEGFTSTLGNSLYVKRYITNSWADMGNLLDVTGGQSAVNSSITKTSDGRPVVAWDEDDTNTGTRNVYVKEWRAGNWQIFGGAVDRIGGDAENPSLAWRSSDNRPTVAWQENNNVYVKRWNGSIWTSIGIQLESAIANDALTPSLALDTANLPVVAYAENGNILVKKASGTSGSSTWNSPFGTAALDTALANEAYRPSLAIKSDNNPIVAWYEDVGTSFNIYAKEWNGTAWVALGTTIDKTASRDAKDIVLAIRSDNRPVVAWEEAGNIYVKRWTGSSWVSLGGTLDKTAGNEALRPSIDLRTDNNPVVSWQEWNGTSYDVWVKRWTGSTWTLIANIADRNPARDAERPSLVLKSNNSPILSWDEWDGVSENIYVRQY